jgi:hypothetical protein
VVVFAVAAGISHRSWPVRSPSLSLRGAEQGRVMGAHSCIVIAVAVVEGVGKEKQRQRWGIDRGRAEQRQRHG